MLSTNGTTNKIDVALPFSHYRVTSRGKKGTKKNFGDVLVFEFGCLTFRVTLKLKHANSKTKTCPGDGPTLEIKISLNLPKHELYFLFQKRTINLTRLLTKSSFVSDVVGVKLFHQFRKFTHTKY